MALIWIEQKPKEKNVNPTVSTAGDKPIFGKKIAMKIAQMTGVVLPGHPELALSV